MLDCLLCRNCILPRYSLSVQREPRLINVSARILSQVIGVEVIRDSHPPGLVGLEQLAGDGHLSFSI